MQKLSQPLKNLYDTDYNLWVLETVKYLEKGDFQAVDLENLIAEVLDLSKRDKRKLKSLLKQLFEHLLKLKYWQQEVHRNQRHWRGKIVNFRQQIKDLLDESPSLKSYLLEILDQSYREARLIVSTKSELPLNTFPENAIANLDQVLDENWFPEVSSN